MIGELSLSFSGDIHNIFLNKIMDLKTGYHIDISNVSAEEVKRRVDSGDWTLSFQDCMDGGLALDVDMVDIEVQKSSTSSYRWWKYMCPKCKDHGLEMDVIAKVRRSLIQHNNGEFETAGSRLNDGDDWDESSGMICRSCDYAGTVKEFEV